MKVTIRDSSTLPLILSTSKYFRNVFKGLASYCKAETTFTFHFSMLTLQNAFLSIDNREIKSDSGFSFAMASQPFEEALKNRIWITNDHKCNTKYFCLFLKSLYLKKTWAFFHGLALPFVMLNSKRLLCDVLLPEHQYSILNFS